MRRIVHFRVTIIFCAIFWMTLLLGATFAQEWVKMMEDPNANFYDIQRSFNAYWEGRTVEKGKGWMPYKRWEYFMEPRVYPTGIKPDPERASRVFLEYLRTHNGSLESANWTSLGPSAWVNGNSGYNPGLGRINGSAVHPTNSNTIFVGSPSGGLWKTTDGGATWNTTTDNLSLIGATSIVVHPTTPNTMYMATGDGDASINYYSIGVLKSTDGGNTWNPTGLNWTVTQSRRISKLLIHPTNPSILLAATSIGIYKTVDAGVTWTQSTTGSFKDIEFKPGDPTTVYASGSQFYKSTNTGDSFSLITSGLPTSGVYRMAIGVSSANSSYVYILACNNTNYGFLGVYRSIDSGITFSSQSSSPNLLGYEQNGSDTGGQGWYDLAIAVSPTNANEVYTGGINVWKSTDGGVTWANKSYWIYQGTPAYTHADIHALDFYGTVLYVGSDGGFFKSADGGTTWTDLSTGLGITQIYRIGGYPANANLVYAGAQDNGSNRYSGTNTWTHVLGADGMETAIDYTNSNIVYVCIQNGGLRKSTNGGSNFSSITSGITEGGAWVTPYVLDPVNPQILYAGYVNIWKTTNGGTSWSKISNFTTSTFNALAVAPSNPNYIYASKSSTLYRTTDGGANWTTISTGLPGLYISYIAVASNDPNKIWVTLSAYTSGQKVYASTNGGTTWTNYSGTLPNLPINCIVHASSSNDALYVGADVGLYYRDNSLSDWQLYNNGLPNVIVTELEVHQSAGKLRAATYGRGLWESPLATPGTPSLSINDVTVTEGDAGTINANFTVTLSPTSTQVVTASYATANGTATAGSDYVAQSGTLTFPAGSTTQTISVAVSGDVVFESNETFFVNLSNSINATITDVQGQVTILDNDADVVIWLHADVTDPNIAQKAQQRGLTEAQVRTMAQRPESHSALQAALTANGKSSIVVTDITSVNLSQFEAVFVILGIFPNNHVVLNNSAEALAIVNYIQAGGKVYMEGADMWYYDPASAGGHDFAPLFGLDGAEDGIDDLGNVFGVTGTFTQNMNYTYSGQNNYIDHLTPINGGFTIHTNPSQLPPYDAGIAYSNTGNNSKTIGNAFEFGGLNDNSASSFTKANLMQQYLNHFTPPPVTISINDVSVTEGNTGIVNANFTVTLSTASGQAVTVNYATANGSATAGSDYVSGSGTVTFPAGSTTQTLAIAVNGDFRDELNETFLVNLSNASNATIADNQSQGTIIDDDLPPALAIGFVNVTEGNTGTVEASFTVMLSTESGQIVTVDFATANGTAASGSDYVAGSGTLTFPAGSETQTITILVNGDLLDESNETFFVNLSNATNATIATDQGQGTITDNDPTSTLSINDVSVNEGNTGTVNANFTVTLSATSGQVVTVNYATANGTATAGSDYVAGSGTVTFPAGTTTQTITVVVNGDVVNEPDETFFVNLGGEVNATITDAQGQGTILNDDGIPSISINDVSVIEGNIGTVNANFTVTLSATSGQVVTVNYATSNGTATAGSDYVAQSGTLTFSAGSTTQTITVVVNSDLLDEPNETFFVDLSNAANATIADNQAQGTITDDDPLPSLSIDDVVVTEGNAGTVNATFTVTLSPTSGQAVTVNYATANGTATVGSDYVSGSGTVIFPAGSTTQTLTVAVNGDLLDEPNETFFVDLSNAANATIADNQGQGTVTDDDVTSIAINDVSVNEGNTGSVNANFTMTLSVASSLVVTVNYATANGTATSGSDYVAGSGTVTFPVGTTTQTITVVVNGDAVNELDETFFVNLSGEVNAAIADAQGQGTIVNDDGVPTLSINDMTVIEGNTGTVNANFTVTLSAASGQVVTVNYATANGTATSGSDYVAGSGTMAFPAGSTTQTITVVINGDAVNEPDEIFVVDLSGAVNATIADAQGQGTIMNDDGIPSISINDVSVTEGNTGTVNANFTVTLSASSGQIVTANYATANGTATTGNDYVSGSGTVTFSAGSTTQTITVVVNGDLLDEPNETFFVNLSNATNATIADNQGQGTITDGDDAPSITISDVSMNEGNSSTTNFPFTVSLSAASGQVVTVNYETTNGTATAGSDYVAGSGTVTFPAGSTTQTIAVAVNGDLLDEPNETLFVNLSNATNAIIADNQSQGTILDDDEPPCISINDVTVTEGNSGIANATFIVTLSAASGFVVTINYATANGSGTAGSDYIAASGIMTFPAGTTTQNLTVAINGDALNEPNETFFVNLSNPNNATLCDNQGQGTIQNDDAIIIPTLSINDVTIIEGNSGTINAVFTVSLSTTSSQQITVDYATANGTATGGSDYEAIPITQLIIPANTPSQTITVIVNGDLFDESDETFFVNLTNPANATLADAQGLGTITDDDSPSQTITLNPTDDAYVNANQPTANFGTATTLRMKQSSPIVNSYLKFVVSGIAVPIQSAKIRMTVTVASSSGGSVYSVSNNYLGTSTPWIETGLNYNNAPAISGTPWDTEGSVTVGQVVELDVTSAVTGNGTFSFGLKNSSTTTVQYSSEEGATKPQLVIQTGAMFPSLSINDVTVTEGNVGNVNATFTASLSAPSSQVVTVSYSTADGTASAGSDYVSASGIVSFPIGTTTQSVTISVIGDAVIESNETFFVNLSNATNATIADAQGQGTITDDDIMTITLNPTDDAYVNANQATTNFGTQTTLRMRLSSPIINSYLKFTVNGVSGTILSAKLRMAVTVASSSGGSIYSVSNNYLGTSTPWIETGLNYNNAPTISGTPWDTEGSVTVGQVVEFDVTPAITGNGTFSFGLKNSSTTTVQYSSDEGTIKPQLVIQFAPGPPSLSINDVTVLEGNSGTVNASFTVSLSAASNQVVSVNYTTANGTAAAGSDYVAASGSVTFPIGVTTQPIVVSVIGDILTESNETFFVNLSNPVNATIADAQGLGTITDDDIVTITLNPTDDAFVRSDQPTTNNGTATTLRMKQSSPIINSYLKFTVSGVSGTVSSAKLRLAVTVASSSGGSVYSVSNNLQGTSTPWTQSNLNYSNAPVISGTPLFIVGSVTVGQVVEFDVKAAITGNGIFSFGLNNASTTMVQYSSNEGATKPALVIQTGATSTAKILDLGTDSFTLESAEATTPLPKEFTLSANYPNPFNAQTVIEYALPEAVQVRLVIFNVLGQRIRQLVDENQAAGYKRLIWNGRNEFGMEVGSGIYFLQLNVGPQRFTRKIFLQR